MGSHFIIRTLMPFYAPYFIVLEAFIVTCMKLCSTFHRCVLLLSTRVYKHLCDHLYCDFCELLSKAGFKYEANG